MMNKNAFSEPHKQGVYKAIYERRDMRHFIAGPVDEQVLSNMLNAFHAGPSVGYMQPWRIIRIKNPEMRQSIHQCVDRERRRTAAEMGKDAERFMSLKLEGILECAEVWAVTLMNERERHLLGRRTMPQMDVASVACAIQNLWLAGRAEGIGVGWVSIYDPQELADLLNLPSGTETLAILCIGHVDAFYPRPMLQDEGWAERGKLTDYVMNEQWEQDKAERSQQQWRDRDAKAHDEE